MSQATPPSDAPDTAPPDSPETRTTHPVDQVLPPARLLTLGLQHVLVMYTGCVTVPLVFGAAAGLDTHTIGLLIDADLVVAGVVTIIQSLGIGKLLGIRLPIVAGATFTAVSPMILIASEYGLPAVYGSMLAAGLFGILIAIPFSRIVRFFPPLVSGTVITVIGLSLIRVAVNLVAGDDATADDYASMNKLALAAGIIIAIILVTRYARGFVNQLAVMIGLVLGTAVAIPMDLTDFSAVGDAAWVGLTRPFYFGAPEFPVAAVVSMCVVMLVIFVESTADMLAVAELVDKKITNADLARGLATDGLSGIFAGAMNSFLDTAFAQNVGLISMTRVRSRFVVTVAGAILLLLGLVPKLGAIIASLPGPVVGAAGLVMFAMVTAVGIRTLRRVEYQDNNNLMVVAVSIGVGMLPVVAPSIYSGFPDWFQTIFGSAITSATMCAFLLNLLFNHGWRRSAPGEPPAPDDPGTAPSGTAQSGEGTVAKAG